VTTRVKRDLARKRLATVLSMADDGEFLQMIWCMDRIRSGSFDLGAQGIGNLPQDFRVRLADKRDLYVQPWILEDLVNELLTVAKSKNFLPQRIACDTYEIFRAVYNRMLDVNDVESGFELSNGRDVLQAMPRFGHRQFDWQQGWLTATSLYRSAFIYGRGECASWFQDTHGLTPSEFILFAVGAFMSFGKTPHIQPSAMMLPALGLDGRVVEAGLALMCRPLSELREEAARTRRGRLNITARPSVLRRNPMIYVAGRGLIAPLADLVAERATAGLYLDLVKAPSSMRNVIAANFEQYAFDLLRELFGDDARREYAYGRRGNSVRTPDLFLGAPESIKVIMECKATRMSFAVRFSDDWHEETERGYRELAKGVGQIWRHCSHMRRGLVSDRPSSDIVGHVLTIDPWMRLTTNQDEKIFQMAREWCADTDPLICAEDECPVGFLPIVELEDVLHRTNSEGVLTILKNATRKIGWASTELVKEDAVEKVERTFLLLDRVPEVLPWYNFV
jgi:hypothetical protein